MVTMQLRQTAEAVEGLAQIGRAVLTAPVKVRIVQAIKLVRLHFDVWQETREAIALQYAEKDETGAPLCEESPAGSGFRTPPQNIYLRERDTRIAGLSEVALDILPFTMADFPQKKDDAVSATALAMLGPLLILPEEPNE